MDPYQIMFYCENDYQGGIMRLGQAVPDLVNAYLGSKYQKGGKKA